jgi:hypothetical protein
LILAIEAQNQKCLTTQLLRPFIFGHPVVLVGGFADVDATWQWDPHVSIFSLLFVSSLRSSLHGQPSSLRRRATRAPVVLVPLTPPCTTFLLTPVVGRARA